MRQLLQHLTSFYAHQKLSGTALCDTSDAICVWCCWCAVGGRGVLLCASSKNTRHTDALRDGCCGEAFSRNAMQSVGDGCE